MRTEKFKDLFWFGPKSNIKAGDGLEKGRFPFYTSSPKQTKWIDKEQHFDEALIFGTGGLASVHFEDQPFSTSTDCIVAITTNKEIKTKFVYYYLFGNIHLLERGFKGAGLKHISKKYIENLDIPIFPIDTQNKIVSILDKAFAIVNKRKVTNEIIDDLLRATYLDMFGDPITNPKGWEILEFKQVVKNENSKRVPVKQADRDLREGNYPYYGATGIIDTIDDYKFDGEFLLIAEDGKNLLFRKKDNAFIATGKFWVNNHAHVLSFNGVCQLQFLKFFLNSIDFKPYITGIDQVKLNKDNLEKIPVPVPPLELQSKFTAFERSYTSLKLKMQIAKPALLFDSILQKVFNGQLNYNVDFELDSLIQEIDLQNKENDLSKITGDIAYLQRLIDKLNNQEFKEKDLYDKAKHGIFQLMAVKEEERKVVQEYDENSKRLKLALK